MQDEQLHVQKDRPWNLAESSLCIHWHTVIRRRLYHFPFQMEKNRETIQLMLQLVLIATGFKPFQ